MRSIDATARILDVGAESEEKAGHYPTSKV